MSGIDNIQDKIDEYIRGTMSAKDRAIFEEELYHDADLRNEVEIQSSIADAVQVVQLRRLFDRVESGMHSNGKQDTTNRIFKKQWMVWTSVAAVFVLFVLGGNSMHQMYRVKGFGSEYYEVLTEPTARGGNLVDSLLLLGYSQIGIGNLDIALGTLENASIAIGEGLAAPVTNEETEYEHTMLQEKEYEVQWYRAIVYMKQGKVRKSKTLLKAIAGSSSPYADNAKEILNQMFNIKI